ncbi:hydrolase [Legionella londiniensis]|uniref:Carboxypeptidase G2 n=1 Tax=Legionella londiniensis TaxID=45068 RepID=A0A0W0VLS9_9GAMM|nr:hydrolase [Legionella londiniensis]KTD21106.1 carboxypeptidase G2 [Legionella londiniensis]STX93128.1 carboxypeptidase G2 [Legionella londiniensis]
MNKSSLESVRSIKANQQTMVRELHELCGINSGSANLKGLAKVSKLLQSLFRPLADEIHTRSFPPASTINMAGETILETTGDALYIRKRPELRRRILLCGHMDTVYDTHHPFQTMNYINDNCINGPGVADMKGGLLVMLHALNAFESSGHADTLGWDVMINADEEIGSPASGALWTELAYNYQAALVYEPAMTPEGMLAKNRKGNGKLTLIAKGKASHAGRAFAEGRNAICYLAEAITAVHALNGLKEGVTINVGKVAGGEALNIVPDQAVAKLDIRISQPDDEYWVRTQIDNIIKKLNKHDYSLSVHGSFDRPVKRVNAATERLFERIKQIGQELGIAIDWQDSGGCCDGNNLSKLGLPVIDTLGVRGGKIHSPEEYILLDSLPERAALSALLLIDLAQGGLEELKGTCEK